jgi:hypothetical protein
MDFTNQATPVPRIINRILRFFAVIGAPNEKFPVRDLNLPAVPDEVDPVFGIAKKPLNTYPSMNAALPLNYLSASSTGAFGLTSWKPLPARETKRPITQVPIDRLKSTNRPESWAFNNSFFAPGAWVSGLYSISIHRQGK